MTALLDRLEAYYDAVPRRFAQVEECGPFTLFLGEPGGWTYYARPRLGGPGRFDATAVAAATARLRQLERPEVIEWVHETTPGLRAAVQDEGSLVVEEIPLMVFRDGAVDRPAPVDGIRVRLLAPGEGELLAAARAVADVGFASSGTARGFAGPAERDAALLPPQTQVLELIAGGSALVAVAISGSEGVATGRAMPVGDVAEIVGVATLPTARRRGAGALLTALLVQAVRDRGVGTAFLTAGSEDVARVYSRVGFARVGTGLVAERRS